MRAPKDRRSTPPAPDAKPYIERPRGCLPPLLLVLLLASGCTTAPDAQAIIDRAIAAHGGEHLDHAVLEFDYRGRHFTVVRDGGLFSYERAYTDSTGQVREVLNNDEVYREVDGQRVPLSDRQRRSVESGINSVVYFALLPYPLNDPAVQKRYLGEAAVYGEPYHKVEITFRQEGGGRDYEDRFVYWIRQDDYTMDYLAYQFHVDGGGTRFRKAVNPRTVGGVRFADYLNYTSDVLGDEIERYHQAMEDGDLNLVSEVVLRNIEVRPLAP